MNKLESIYDFMNVTYPPSHYTTHLPEIRLGSGWLTQLHQRVPVFGHQDSKNGSSWSDPPWPGGTN